MFTPAITASSVSAARLEDLHRLGAGAHARFALEITMFLGRVCASDGAHACGRAAAPSIAARLLNVLCMSFLLSRTGSATATQGPPERNGARAFAKDLYYVTGQPGGNTPVFASRILRRQGLGLPQVAAPAEAVLRCWPSWPVCERIGRRLTAPERLRSSKVRSARCSQPRKNSGTAFITSTRTGSTPTGKSSRVFTKVLQQ